MMVKQPPHPLPLPLNSCGPRSDARMVERPKDVGDPFGVEDREWNRPASPFKAGDAAVRSIGIMTKACVEGPISHQAAPLRSTVRDKLKEPVVFHEGRERFSIKARHRCNLLGRKTLLWA